MPPPPRSAGSLLTAAQQVRACTRLPPRPSQLPRTTTSPSSLTRHLSSSAAPVACYSSPLGRAYDTAGIIASHLGGLEVRAEPKLTERNFGCLEALTEEQQREKFPEAARCNRDRTSDYAPPGGESRGAARARALEGLKEIAQRHAGERVLVVTHSGLLASLMVGFLNMGVAPHHSIRPLAFPNTAINLVRWKGGGWQVCVPRLCPLPLSLRLPCT